jgi:hypothetical protein
MSDANCHNNHICRPEQGGTRCALLQLNIVRLVLWSVARILPLSLCKTCPVSTHQKHALIQVREKEVRWLLFPHGTFDMGVHNSIPNFQLPCREERLLATTTIALA